MGFFSNIMEKMGIREAVVSPEKTDQTPSSSVVAPMNSDVEPTQPALNSIAVVDVMAVLEQRSKSNPQRLNWRTSIVDLLKLLEIDSSLAARKVLADELNCPSELIEDSKKMNTWLHKKVLAHVAANGGNVPKELLD